MSDYRQHQAALAAECAAIRAPRANSREAAPSIDTRARRAPPPAPDPLRE